MNDLVSYHLEDGIATLTLDNGKVNAVSHEVIEAFHGALDRALADQAVVIITGTPGMFSGGYDLKVMTSGPQNAIALVAAGSGLARRMLAHPFPIIAACTGHAVAKGAFLLLSADYRVGVDGPVQDRAERGSDRHDHAPRRHRAGPRPAAQVLLQPLGDQRRDVRAAEAVTAGFLDAVVAADELMPTALAMAEQMKS